MTVKLIKQVKESDKKHDKIDDKKQQKTDAIKKIKEIELARKIDLNKNKKQIAKSK